MSMGDNGCRFTLFPSARDDAFHSILLVPLPDAALSDIGDAHSGLCQYLQAQESADCQNR
jgi:hypothetical protein